MIETDAKNESKGAWRESPYTTYLKAEVRKTMQIRLDLLISKAHASSDPNVVAAHGAYVAAVAQLKMLETGEA